MKKIGFIDYFLDEWHANSYPLMIEDPGHFGQYQVAYAWAAMNKPDGLTTEQWCAQFGVTQAASQEDLIRKSDCIIVLSPDHPEQHEALADLALKSGKPVYVDKTFAISCAAAERMFDLAEMYGTPMYSTSALRYASELNWLRKNKVAQVDVEFASARGPGIFDNYGIHQIEMIVAAMGTGAKRAIALGTENAPMVVYEYAGGRRSIVNHLSWSGFSLTVQDKYAKGSQLTIVDNYWKGFVNALLKFFDTGVPAVPRAETFETIAMVEAGLTAMLHPDVWVHVPTVTA